VAEVETAREGAVLTITLNRPDVLNAFNTAMHRALAGALRDARAPEVRAVVLTGAGRGFCVGQDLTEFRDASGDIAGRLRESYHPNVLAIRALEKPVIAAVNGAAAGAGFGLALACDLRLVAASARLTAGYVRRGLSPDAGVSYFLPRHVGLARAADILLTGRDVDAEEAARIGLATEVVADDAFVARVHAYAALLATGAPIAHSLTKRLLARSLDTELDAALRDELVSIKQCFTTRDVAEAIAAFREKRRPVFRGE